MQSLETRLERYKKSKSPRVLKPHYSKFGLRPENKEKNMGKFFFKFLIKFKLIKIQCYICFKFTI